jgi:hypothetical protein
MSYWHKFFIDYYDDDVKKEAATRVDNTISDDDERFPFEG